MAQLIESLVVVGISGPAGSGKDAAADAIAHDRGAMRVALGDAMKASFDDLSGITRELHKDLDSPDWPLRKVWQLLGTEARADVPGAHLAWVQVTLMKIAYACRHHRRPRRRFVVPDVRYPYEAAGLADVVRGWGGHYGTLALSRPGLAAPAGIAGHSSEAHFGAIRAAAEATYPNVGTLAELRGAAVAFYDGVAEGMYDPFERGRPRGPVDLAILDGEAA